MSFTNTYARTWTASTGGSISKSVSKTAGAKIEIDETIAISTTNQEIAFVCDVSQLKGLYIVASNNLVLETNSGSSPVNTFTLAAGVPYMWVDGDAAIRDTAGTAVTTDITALFATNASSTLTSVLQIRALVDPTV